MIRLDPHLIGPISQNGDSKVVYSSGVVPERGKPSTIQGEKSQETST